MRHPRALLTTISSISLALTGCGGDGSGGNQTVAVTPAPSPTPSPGPTPTPTPSPVAYTPNALPSTANAQVGLNQQTTFPTIGFQYRDAVGATVQSGIAVGYDAAKTSTTVSLPSYPAGYLDALGAPASGFTQSLLVPAGGIEFSPLQPRANNPFFGLSFTSIGSFARSNRLAIQATPVEGVLAYGVPTAAGAFPASGLARYTLYGRAMFIEVSEGAIRLAFGGEIDVDFASRIVTGRFVVRDDPGFGSSNFVTATLSGGTLGADGAISGTITVPGQSNGSFSGRLTGPQGEELMFDWTATYPTGPSANRFLPYYGVFIGKR